MSTEAGRVSEPPELKLQAVVSFPVWVLGTEPGSSAKAASAFTAGSSLKTSPCPHMCSIRLKMRRVIRQGKEWALKSERKTNKSPCR